MNITCPRHISLMLLPGQHTFITHPPASTTGGVSGGGRGSLHWQLKHKGHDQLLTTAMEEKGGREGGSSTKNNKS
ncbi:hypothetical protein E2C01_016907 [Portunus trituberculatus]|uniref:Uncharacterized protein n=1 Tax=Portunus trituberculatus TaxID=210409 RepID=A0A5B7DQW1_PORTR|nr:hypothetical protein [Portunus trituberculatus]